MCVVYDLIFLIFMAFNLPGYLIKRKLGKSFLERCGLRLPKVASSCRPVWIHAVSVGEVLAVGEFYSRLRKAFPDKPVIVSTVTDTGNALAKKVFPQAVVFYLPFDLSWVVRKVVSYLNPGIFISVETELWPNLIRRLWINKVAIVVVNGRISDKSFWGYMRIRKFISPILRMITLLCVRGIEDKERLESLGAFPSSVTVTGNMKFDWEMKEGGAVEGVSRGESLWVCGSTHPGEEELIFAAFDGVRRDFPGLRLLLAPRHVERSDEIIALARKYGLKARTVSSLPAEGACGADILVLDVIGRLAAYYEAASVVFVGGSLMDHGGHNIIEPAFFAKPVITGPYMANFRDVAVEFRKDNALVTVHGSDELARALKDLLNNAGKRDELGRRAKAVITRNRGAVEATVAKVGEVLRASGSVGRTLG